VKRRLFGLASRTCFLIVFLAVGIIVGGVVGGVIGGVAGSRRKSIPSSTAISTSGAQISRIQPSGTLTFAVSGSKSLEMSTASSMPAIPPAEKGFKFVSIAVCQCEYGGRVQLLVLDSTTTSGYILGDLGWNIQANSTPIFLLKVASSQAAISWTEEGYDATRISYFDSSNRMIEIAGLCAGDGTAMP
jgi:hypothetical protein